MILFPSRPEELEHYTRKYSILGNTFLYFRSQKGKNTYLWPHIVTKVLLVKSMNFVLIKASVELQPCHLLVKFVTLLTLLSHDLFILGIKMVIGSILQVLTGLRVLNRIMCIIYLAGYLKHKLKYSK